MKTIFTLLSSLIMSIAVMAAPKDDARQQSMLTVQSADRGDIRVIVDGRRFEPNDNYLRIQSIESGYHDVKVYREKNSGLLTIFGKRYEVVFSKSIMIKPRTAITLNVDRFGSASVQEARMRGNSRGGKNWDNNHDFRYDRGGDFGDYDNGHNGRVDDHEWKSPNGNYSRAMSDFEFNRVLNSIEKEWFENNKAKSATQIIQTNFMTSSQVKQILQLFSQENTKLDLAKLAYKKTVDPKNYFLVNDAFRFNNSKDELARYIKSCE